MATRFKFGDLELDVTAYELRRLGRRVKIERIPMDLLILLIERQGELVSRAEIVERIWGKESYLDAESGVNTAVRKIREALRDKTANPAFIQTISGKGYRFCGNAVAVDGESAGSEAPAPVPTILPLEKTAEPDQVAGPDAGETEPRRPVWSPKRKVGATAAAILIGFFALYLVRSPRTASLSAAHVIVALLPFENLTGDPQQEYFADGLTEETIAVLGKLNPHRMSVIARTSTMSYKRHTKMIREIGKELGADYLLEGSVRRERETVRVIAKLIRVSDQSPIWSETYDRLGAGVIQIQDELGKAIARQIQVELLPGETNQRKQTQILDAYDPYLLGKHFWNQVTPGAVRKSIEYFQTAIAKDPSYALAFAGLADAYTILPITADVAPRDTWQLARNAASEAIRLNSSLAEAQSAGGYVDFWLEWNWDRAADRLRRAIQLNPNSASAHRYYGHLLSNSGRHDDAISEITKAHQLDPFSPITSAMAGQFLFYSGRYPEAIQALNKSFALDPAFWVGHVMMGQIYERMGQPREAIERFDQAYRSSGGNTLTLALKGYVLARSSRRPEAEHLLQGLIDAEKQHFVPPYNIALVYAGLGNADSALQWLNKGYDSRDVHMVFLPIDPKWNDMRSDARFQELLKRMKNPDPVAAR